MLPSAPESTVVSNSSAPPRRLSRPDHLHPLPGGRQLPVGIDCAGREFAQRLDPVGLRLSQLADQIADQLQLADAGPEHGGQIARPDRSRQIADTAVLEEFRRPSRERPEQQPRLAVHDAGVQVRRRHPGRTRCRQAVDLGPVSAGDRGVAAAQESSTDREAAKTLGFLDAGLLQQRQRLPARADEDEFCAQRAVFAGATITHCHRPTAVAPTRQIADLVSEQH